MQLTLTAGLNGQPDERHQHEGTTVKVRILGEAGTARAREDYLDLESLAVGVERRRRSGTQLVDLSVSDNDAADGSRVLVFQAQSAGSLAALDPGLASLTTADDDGGQPTASQNLTAESGAPGTVNLSWEGPEEVGATKVTGYRIDASSDGETWSVLRVNTASPESAFTDLALAPGETSYCRVAAINDRGAGQVSEVAPSTAAK